MWTGKPLPRLEDQRLLTGQGNYVEDIRRPDMAHAVMLRSPVAHAEITNIDLDDALEVPGVLAIYTGLDVVRAGMKPLPCKTPIDSADGTPFKARLRLPLAVDEVRFVGDAVAMVVAETPEAALDALELIDVDYDDRDHCVEPAQSEDIAFNWAMGDEAAAEAALDQAAHVVSITATANRVVISPLETRSAVGEYDAAGDRYTLHTQTQGVHFMRNVVAETLNLSEDQLRVVNQDIGGSFGMKLVNFPEQSMVLHAAKDLGRPVRWVGSRQDAFLTDAHGRDDVSTATAAFDAEGKILGLKIDNIGNIGAYASALGPSIVSKGFAKPAGHVYHLPVLYVASRGVYTNTAPTDAYRGAGKPESVALVERLLDKAAREIGIDRVELRRRNLIPEDAMPYKAANGSVYDSARFEEVMDQALQAADWTGFETRRKAAAEKGLRRGIGLGLYLHLTGGDAGPELSEVIVTEAGDVLVKTGVQASGQGHETAFAQLVADRLEIDPARIRVIEGDTESVKQGGGTGGSSSLPIAATTITRATQNLLDNARNLAADHLEASPLDLEYSKGCFAVVGTDKSISLFDLAADLSEEKAGQCAGLANFEGEHQTVPHGAYVAEVEIDPETGRLRLDKFTAVDDLGRRLNPLIANGQLHGGLAQGIGPVFLENTVYDPDSGQMVSGSFMDYCLPRADDLPDFDLVEADMPTEENSLGMKGAGEVGCIGAPGAVMNAICDALGHDDIDMPATAERLWRACHKA